MIFNKQDYIMKLMKVGVGVLVASCSLMAFSAHSAGVCEWDLSGIKTNKSIKQTDLSYKCVAGRDALAVKVITVWPNGGPDCKMVLDSVAWDKGYTITGSQSASITGSACIKSEVVAPKGAANEDDLVIKCQWATSAVKWIDGGAILAQECKIGDIADRIAARRTKQVGRYRSCSDLSAEKGYRVEGSCESPTIYKVPNYGIN